MSEEFNEEELMAELLQDFLETTPEILEDIEAKLMNIQESESIEEVLDVKRMLHSLKGSAQAIDLKVIGDEIHNLETVIDTNVTAKSITGVYDNTMGFVDGLRKVLSGLADGQTEESLKFHFAS